MITATEPRSTRWWRPLDRSDRTALLWIVVAPVLSSSCGALWPSRHRRRQPHSEFPAEGAERRQIATAICRCSTPTPTPARRCWEVSTRGAVSVDRDIRFRGAHRGVGLNLIAVYVTAALGMYALLRWHGLRSLPSVAAALSYAFTGAMVGQIVHLGVVQDPPSFLGHLDPGVALSTTAISRTERRMAPIRARGAAGTMWFGVLWG